MGGSWEAENALPLRNLQLSFHTYQLVCGRMHLLKELAWSQMTVSASPGSLLEMPNLNPLPPRTESRSALGLPWWRSG